MKVEGTCGDGDEMKQLKRRCINIIIKCVINVTGLY